MLILCFTTVVDFCKNFTFGSDGISFTQTSKKILKHIGRKLSKFAEDFHLLEKSSPKQERVHPPQRKEGEFEQPVELEEIEEEQNEGDLQEDDQLQLKEREEGDSESELFEDAIESREPDDHIKSE